MEVGVQFTSSIAGVKFTYVCVGHTANGTPIVTISDAVESENAHKPKRNKVNKRAKSS